MVRLSVSINSATRACLPAALPVCASFCGLGTTFMSSPSRFPCFGHAVARWRLGSDLVAQTLDFHATKGQTMTPDQRLEHLLAELDRLQREHPNVPGILRLTDTYLRDCSQWKWEKHGRALSDGEVCAIMNGTSRESLSNRAAKADPHRGVDHFRHRRHRDGRPVSAKGRHQQIVKESGFW